MRKMTATTTHLVDFYNYRIVETTKLDEPAIELRSPDGDSIISTFDMSSKFEKITFIGKGDESTFEVDEIIM